VEDHCANQQNGEKAKNCVGIKTASYFLVLQEFNIVDGFTFDYMHTILLG